ncbi:DUF4232 domain-containing protein [Streptomyces sp. SBT349]|uniref:DUF4232 domain-containing protein n=1 Tax=Streptomyces sp. SBT349 TaxID=1580539 RepID=UPI00069D83AE|nr:DUF4232 domain-containing protein [Streptomyces sp. SBT349]
MTTTAQRRRTRVRAAAAALGATLALTLTACQEEDAAGGTGGSGGSPAPSAGAESSPEPGGDDTAGETEDGGTAGGGGRTEPEENAIPCTVDTIELAATQVERPLNHMLLTATNTGDGTCYAFHGPFLRLGDDAQAAVPRFEGSKPQAVVALAPGESAYAGVLTSSAALEAEGGYTATSLGVQFADAEDAGIEGMADVPLPGGEVYVDDSAGVSYWQTSLDAALSW